MPFIRALNYHDVSPASAPAFEAQLQWYAERFVPVGRAELEALAAGRWSASRPGLLISFDDGLYTHASVAAPLLEKYGWPGWFFVPPALTLVPPLEQRAAAQRATIRVSTAAADGRVFMSSDDMRALDVRHVIGAHTATHVRLAAGLSPEMLEQEVRGAKRMLEAELGHEVDSFCWVGGEEDSYSSMAAEMIRRAGYRWSFMTNNAPIRPAGDGRQLQRTNVEASYPLSLVRFQLSGLMDILYTPKRRRVNRLTRTPH